MAHKKENVTFDENEIKKAELRCEKILAGIATETDCEIVKEQLGRFPRGMVAVGRRCACGNPLATVTRAKLEDGTPFPTTFYLCSPQAVRAVSKVEANGHMKRFNELLASDLTVAAEYRKAHREYLAFRHVLAQKFGDDEEHISGISAGGMPDRVKCLHALIAQSLSMGRGVNPIGDMTLDMVKNEFDPDVCRCEIPLREREQFGFDGNFDGKSDSKSESGS